MNAKIPATVITGFLGAGKTTLIADLLANADGRKIALIINEFGEMGIDAELLRGCGDTGCSSENMIELTNGCICCSVADDFIPAITQLLARRPRPDHIIIETSGLALPQPLVHAFNWPQIRAEITVDGVVTIIDSAAVSAGRFADDEVQIQAHREADKALEHESPLAELFEDQINCADMIVLNKADLLDESTLAQVHNQIKTLSRRPVRLVHAHYGRLPPQILLGIHANAQNDLDSRKSHHEMHHANAEDHSHDEFVNFEVRPGKIHDIKRFIQDLQEILKVHDILRLKGFIHVSGKPMRLLIQAVGARLEHYFDRQWSEDEERQSRLVVIGLHDMDISEIKRAIGMLGQSI